MTQTHARSEAPQHLQTHAALPGKSQTGTMALRPCLSAAKSRVSARACRCVQRSKASRRPDRPAFQVCVSHRTWRKEI